MRFDDLNDPLDDLIGAPLRSAPAKPIPEMAKKAEFFDRCAKCGGSGIYLNFGKCFACNGKGGKTFKTSPAERAKGRMQAAARELRRQNTNAAEFAKEFPAEAAWMKAKKATFEFAGKMLEAVEKYGTLTEGQMAAVRKCLMRDEARATEREAAKVKCDVSLIEKAFAIARERANRPGQMGVWTKPLPLSQRCPDCKGDPEAKESCATCRKTGIIATVTFQPGSVGSKWEGMVFVKTEDGRKLGHVKDGKFAPRFGCTEADTAAVMQCASDPADAAKAYGKAWSRCCVCSRTLTNDGSIEAGIGPVCAANYGF